jgi:hypothetical protein
MKTTRLQILLAAALVGTLSFTSAQAQQAPPPKTAGEWQYRGSIYAYLPTIGGTTNFPTGSSDGSGLNVTAETILEHLKFTFMGAIDAHNGKWGVFSDVIYLDLGGGKSQTRDFSLGNAAVPAGTNANLNLDIKGWVWTTAGQYRVVSDPGFTMDVLAGARYLDLDLTLEYEFSGNIATLPIPGRAGSLNAGSSVWDGIVGVKGRLALGSDGKWSVPYYLDVGAGQSKSTFQAATGVSYAFKWGEVIALWRYLDYQFKSGKNVQDVNFNGPMVGAAFRW